jgi:hypothetical protein
VIPALVEPSVLRQVRESVNPPLAATRKLRLPEDRVEQWEAGASARTIPQLRKVADLY